jgi:hypothetical protein
MEYLFRVAFEMDVTLWGDVEKTITGNMNGKKFMDTYIPKEDIGDRRDLRVDYGFGVGGYQGFLMHLQAGDAGYMSKRKVMESMPGVSDVAEELRTIEQEALSEAAKAAILAQAAQGALDVRMVSEIDKMMGEKGMTLLEAVGKMQEQLAAQAQAAQGTDQAALTAPLPEEVPAEPELPGIPPSVLAGV